MSFQPGSQARNFANEVDFTIGAEAANVINVAIQVQSNNWNVDDRTGLVAYLSDDANGDGVTAAAPSGGVAEGTDGNVIELLSDTTFMLLPNATGALDIDITEAGAATWHLVVVLPTGRRVVSDAVTFAA